MFEPSSVVLGRCDFCKQNVAHDEPGAEFVYDGHDPLKLERVACAECAAKHLGGLPPGTTPEEFVAYLVGVAGPGSRAAAESLARRLSAGEHVPSQDVARLLGLTPAKRRHLRAFTTAEERLRRHREAQEAGGRRPAGAVGLSRELRRRLLRGRGVNKGRGVSG